MSDQSSNPGRGLKIFGILLIIAGAIFYAAAGDVEENPIALLGGVIMALGVLVHFRGRKQAAKAIAAAPQSSLHSAAAHVLYLRSFRTDASSSAKVLSSGLSTEEEQLADALRPFGQLIAIGKPGEPLPLPGAARMYASDTEWKDIVLDRMQSASLVVIRASTRRGLLWEVEQAIHLLPPQSVVFFILNMTMKDYHQFAARVHEDLALNLPDVPAFSLLQAVVDYRQNPSKAQSGFLYFPADWTPVFLPLPATIMRLGYNDMRESFNVALRPVFELHGVPWQPLGRFHS
jgi:hypothetical protein